MLLVTGYFLVRGVWRYYQAGELVTHPYVFKLYNGLLITITIILLFGNTQLATWVIILALPIALRLLYTNLDLMEKRRGLNLRMGILVGINLVVLGVGYYNQLTAGQMLAACIVFSLIPFYLTTKYVLYAFIEAGAGSVADMILAEGEFAEEFSKEKPLPSVMLLRHWRENGSKEKAWDTVRRCLLQEPRAYPHWVFAMETAVLLHNPDTAKNILSRLIESQAFDFDQQTVAVNNLETWMRAKGYDFDKTQYVPRQPVSIPSNKPLAVARRNAAAGWFAKAAGGYEKILLDEPLNETALIELVQLYAQDMKAGADAEKCLKEYADYYPPAFIEYLHKTIPDWTALEPRQQRRRWYDRVRPAKGKPMATDQADLNDEGKLVLGQRANKMSFRPPPREVVEHYEEPAEDGFAIHVKRIEEIKSKQEPPPPNATPLEKMIAEHRFGTAIDFLKRETKRNPTNFKLWLQYAELHGSHCGEVKSAERIIEQMERSKNFTDEQIQTATGKLKEWQLKNPVKRAW